MSNDNSSNANPTDKRKEVTATGSVGSIESVCKSTKTGSVTFTDDPDIQIIKDHENEFEERIVAPDGGWGWLIVLASFVSNLVVDGILYSFGILIQPIRAKNQKISLSSVAWISSLASGFHLVIGPVSSAMSHRYGFRIVAVIGSGIAASGILSAWLVCYVNAEPVMPALFVLYGFVGGVGLGMIYCPAILTVGVYFDKRRAFATGIAVCGSGIGTFIFPPITNTILEEDHNAWSSVLLFQAASVLICGVFGLLYKPLKPSTVRKEDIGHDKVKKVLRRSFASPSGSVLLLLPSKSVLRKTKLKSKTKDDGAATPTKQKEILRTASLGSCNDPFDKRDSGNIIIFQASDFPYETGGSSSPEPQDAQNPIRPSIKSKDSDFIPRYGSPLQFQTGSLTDVQNLTLDEQGTIRRKRKSIRFGQNTGSVSSVDSDFNKPNVTITPINDESLVTGTVGSGEKLVPPDPLPIVENTDEEADEASATFCSTVVNVLKGMIDFSLLVSPTFIVLTVSGFFDMLGVGIPYIYLKGYAQETLGNATNEAATTLLISYIGVANMAGRIMCGLVADHPKINVVILKNSALTIVGISIVLVPIFNRYAHYVAFSCVFGFALGSSAALRSALLVELLGVEKVIDAFGLKLLFQGIASLLGPPLAGLEYELTNYSYAAPFYTAGGFIILATILCYPINYVKEWEEKRLAIKNIKITDTVK